MEIKLLDNANDIRAAFTSRFVLSWDGFQIQHKDWIEKMAERNYPISLEWFDRAFLWDRMLPAFSAVSMKEALAFLGERSCCVLFMAEKGEDTCYRGQTLVDFVAEADAKALAARIEQEWFDSYRLAEQNMYDPDAFLPCDLYVFDGSMKWCVVFTHETTDWEAELNDPMKAAESRYCMICALQ